MKEKARIVEMGKFIMPDGLQPCFDGYEGTILYFLQTEIFLTEG